ncbi:uncharacterized protein Z519_09368 [Cladophialophora bantiana CBS 173.52]|uniref:Uncharacterized protein n=1 Tax=Cladophialophora bantiana (strain ATCC 10958 / CBS 173.52 / CDC B-1940 / NIH 8579) TaxID=1442370 RepID=A0A0D2H9L8_CLAB1|nr:uncharacterized protein Z519_09368 [Cladophialophora bantiana CBS 173.52]KIW89938.1 hypothetical protein Z519_09368 [Cladophialophora bantiana CBS 173.52]
MASFSKPLPLLDLEPIIRLLLILNNSVALGLSFAVMSPIFIVLGAVFGISILYNLGVILLRLRQKRPTWNDNNDGREDIRCPSVFQLTIDALGVLTFLVLYVCSTIETATRGSWQWNPTMMMSYSTIGALVAL